jgi:hypothetical protein
VWVKEHDAILPGFSSCYHPSMAPRRILQQAKAPPPLIERATFQPGDYGRVVQDGGTEQWWVRSSNGEWLALSHQRVVENDDGTITLLYLQ